MLLKQSTARNLTVFMTDATDHVTGKTGLTLTMIASKDGAAFASVTPVVTELVNGFYSLALTTTHTNTLGDFAMHITGTGADPTDLIEQVVVDLPGATVASVSGAVGSVTGAVGSVTGITSSDVGAIKAKTDNLPATPASQSDVTTVGTTANTINTRIGAPVGASISADIAAVKSSITTVQTTVNTINAGVSGIPTNPLLTNDARLNHLDADISTRLATSSYTAPDNTDIAAIKLKTDNLPAAPAAVSDVTTVGTAVSSLSAKIGTPAGASVSADIAAIETNAVAIKGKTDNLPAAPAAVSDVTTVGTAVAALSTKIGTPTGASIAFDIGTKAGTSQLTGVETKVTDNGNLLQAINAKVDGIDGISTDLSALTDTIGSPATDTIADDIAANAPDNSSIVIALNNTNTILTEIGSPATGTITGDIAQIHSLANTIKSRTDGLPDNPADGDILGVPVLATIADDIAAVKAKTDNLPALPAARTFARHIAYAGFSFPMVDINGNDLTGGGITATRVIDGGVETACDNAVAEIGHGLYKINLTANDMNGKNITLVFSAVGALKTRALLVTEG